MKSIAIAVTAGLLAATLGGCAQMHSQLMTVDCATGQYEGFIPGQGPATSARLDCGFGDAVNMAIARQLLDPDATRRNGGRSVNGLDGVAAREALTRYQKSFRAPEPAPNVFSIGLPGGSSSSQ